MPIDEETDQFSSPRKRSVKKSNTSITNNTIARKLTLVSKDKKTDFFETALEEPNEFDVSPEKASFMLKATKIKSVNTAKLQKSSIKSSKHSSPGRRHSIVVSTKPLT
jgi:hypothetical protein